MPTFDKINSRRPLVGILANIFEADAGIRAGGHQHFIQVVRRWSDVDIVLFAPEMARQALASALPHARFVSMPALRPTAPKALDFMYRSLFSIRRIKELRKCDAIIATSHLLVDVLPSILSGRPTAVISHHLLSSQRDRSARKGRISLWAERFGLWATRFGNIRAFLTSSELVARDLRARGLAMPVVVSTNGVDHALPAGAVDTSAVGRHGAVFIGRLHPLKNIGDAIRAWRLVVDRFPDERLTIVGPETIPAYLAEMRRLIAELELDGRVTIAGSVSEADKFLALARAKVFLFPSIEEGWGIALAEAMNAGLPCVTYDLPIFAEIFPIGRLEAPLGNVPALAECVIRLMSDELFRQRSADEALKLSQTFSWERASGIAAHVLREMLAT